MAMRCRNTPYRSLVHMSGLSRDYFASVYGSLVCICLVLCVSACRRGAEDDLRNNNMGQSATCRVR